MSLKTRAPNWTNAELEALIDGYILRKDIIDGKFSPELTADLKLKTFRTLTDDVNSVGMGGRTVDQVKKQLSDQKTKTRAKASQNNRERQKTGGGPANCLPLTAIEERLLSVMNTQTITGIISNGECGGPAVNLSQEDTNLRGQSPSSTVAIDSDPKDISMDNVIKRRRLSPYIPKTEDRVTSAHANSILDIERRKLELAENTLRLELIKFRTKLKVLEAKDFDVGQEIQDLEDIHKKSGL